MSNSSVRRSTSAAGKRATPATRNRAASGAATHGTGPRSEAGRRRTSAGRPRASEPTSAAESRRAADARERETEVDPLSTAAAEALDDAAARRVQIAWLRHRAAVMRRERERRLRLELLARQAADSARWASILARRSA